MVYGPRPSCRSDDQGSGCDGPGVLSAWRLGAGDAQPRGSAQRRPLVGLAGHRVARSAGEGTHAATFFAGTHVHHLDYTPAVEAFEAGASAMAAPEPMHASFEDREDAPAVVLAAVDPALAEHLSSVWEPPFLAVGAAEADVFHLDHLTPQHDAVARRWPRVPVVAHLHGTEIKPSCPIQQGRSEVTTTRIASSGMRTERRVDLFAKGRQNRRCVRLHSVRRLPLTRGLNQNGYRGRPPMVPFDFRFGRERADKSNGGIRRARRRCRALL